MLKTAPRQLAQELIDCGTLSDLAKTTSVAGPGFVNITLSDEFLARSLACEPLISPVDDPKRIVLDYSSPNVAKKLHVGHLRSTVIGDAMARMLTLAGHEVIRQNHIGDWGTGFGKLIAFLEQMPRGVNEEQSLEDIEQVYVQATQLFDSNAAFAKRSREAVLLLQRRDPATMAIWERFMRASLSHMQEIYAKLDVLLTMDDVRGESSYSEELEGVLKRLDDTGLLVESDGAKCVFLDDFRGKDGRPLPMIVQKSDGGFLYHTTDLATLLYRVNVLDADQIHYFTDARQILHFQQLFAAANKAGFADQSVKLEHHVFGSIQDSKGQPYRSRDGQIVLLEDLIQEGIARATEIVKQKSEHLDHALQSDIARQVAIGAIKYSDLSKNRINDYRFDWDSMLSLEGNTAPYLQYAHTRIASIFARAGLSIDDVDMEAVSVDHPQEHDLSVRLLRFQEALDQSIAEFKAHHMCNYLYDLTVHFTRFYENCDVLTAAHGIRESRLALCARTAQTLRAGLNCLGIATPRRM